MGLHYKILWVDDQFGELIDYGLKTSIERHLAELGFEPFVEFFEDITTAQQGMISKKYDLIISDYNISEDGNGDLLIQRIREGKIYTEVLFYSAQSEFDAIAKRLYQDRVSFISIAAQDGYDKLVDKAKWLINQTLTKLQEVESIRGLVMSETSQLDDLVKIILKVYFESERENKTKLRDDILKRIEGSLKDNFTKTGELKLRSKTDSEIVQSRIFDASKMARSINKLIELEQIHLADSKFENFFEGYKQHVLDLRNDLAHAKAEMDENGNEYLVIGGEGTTKTRIFNHEETIRIRKTLLRYRTLLQSLKDRITA